MTRITEEDKYAASLLRCTSRYSESTSDVVSRFIKGHPIGGVVEVELEHWDSRDRKKEVDNSDEKEKEKEKLPIAKKMNGKQNLRPRTKTEKVAEELWKGVWD